MIESLYNLDGDELRALAWKSLLISDGPDAVHVAQQHSPIRVEVMDSYAVTETGKAQEQCGFAITAKNGWETGINTMTDTPIRSE
jgi:hypothetical protein